MNGEETSLKSGGIPKVGPVLETALYVDDLDRSVAFYERVLGFQLASEPMIQMRVLSITATQVLLLFRKGESVTATVTPYGTIPPTDGDGSLHVTFFIPGPDFENWRDRLRRLGVLVESFLRWPAGGRSLYFRDPDTHLIELKTSHWDGKELRSEAELCGIEAAPAVQRQMQLYETHLPVASTETSAAFYLSVVGLEFAYRDPTRDAVFLWIGSNRRSMLGLWGPTTLPGKDFHNCHFAIAVSLPELLGAGKRLAASGIECHDFLGKKTTEPSVIGWMPSAQLYFRDPDGHSLEFIALLDDTPDPHFHGSLSAWQKKA